MGTHGKPATPALHDIETLARAHTPERILDGGVLLALDLLHEVQHSGGGQRIPPRSGVTLRARTLEDRGGRQATHNGRGSGAVDSTVSSDRHSHHSGLVVLLLARLVLQKQFEHARHIGAIADVVH
jgi:hypothetical protein